MDLATLFDKVKSTPVKKTKPDWKSKIMTAQPPKDEWDFSNVSTQSNAIAKRAQFHSEWQEAELIYVIQPVHCSCCGWQHDEHWGIFLREVHRSSPATERHTRIVRSLGTYNHLPRRIVTHEAVSAPTCDRCFHLPDGEQLELPWNDETAINIPALANALADTLTIHEKHMKWKEGKSPEQYGFHDPDMEDDPPATKDRAPRQPKAKPVNPALENW